MHLEAIEEFEAEKREFEKNVLKKALEKNGNKALNEAVELMEEGDKGVLARDMLEKLIRDSPELKRETEEKLLKQFEVVKEKKAKELEAQKAKIEEMKERQEVNVREFVKKRIRFIKEADNVEIVEAQNSYEDVTFFEIGDKRKIVMSEEDKRGLAPQLLGPEELQKLIDTTDESRKKLDELKDDVNREKVSVWEQSLKLKFLREKVALLDRDSREVAQYIVYVAIRRAIEVISIREDKIEYMKHFGDYLTDRKLRLDALEHQKLRVTMAKLVFDDFLQRTVQGMVNDIATESYSLAVKVR